ncbi:putative dsRNA-binding protein [Arthrobacter sp. AQ5-05]|uniref:putative dsRNA-binding protein n=1 Tax=Arthrobacter sp. AQ5-05 TaxID=2184581 RepID=UPI0011BF0FEB|nr:putative dsRNA-binding protein [Arthrobacter sp. AQ5-05]
MTAYSFGNKWMGIIALKDPPSAIPEPLHKMAIRLRIQALDIRITLDPNVEVSIAKALELLGRIRHRHVLCEDWTRVDECQRVESALRTNGKTDIRRGLRRELSRELRIEQSRNSGSKNGTLEDQSTSDKSTANSHSGVIPTLWSESVPLAPLHPALPSISSRLAICVQSLGIQLDENSTTWLRWASMHSSYHFEHMREKAPVGVEVLGMLERLGQAWLKVGIMEDLRARDGDFGTSAKVSAALQAISSLSKELGSWISSLECAQLGRGEIVEAEGERRSRAVEVIGAQIVGALCLLSGSYAPAVSVVSKTSAQISLPIDWKTQLQIALKRTPTYVEDRSGPDHAVEFVSTVSDGKVQSLGRGGSRRAAQQDASKNFLAEHLPDALNLNSKREPEMRPKPYGVVSKRHSNCARLMAGKFELSSEALMSQSLTHSSWVYENKAAVRNAGQRDYGVLAAEGSAVVAALAYHQFTVAALGRSLDVSKDLARMPEIQEEAMGQLADALSLQEGILLGRGATMSTKIKSDVAQAIIATAWREQPDKLTKQQPPAVRSWMMSLSNDLGPSTQLDRYCAPLNLQCHITYEQRGEDHSSEYRATYVFNVATSPSWTGPWQTSQRKARTSAAAQIVELLIAQGSGVPADLDAAEQSILGVFLTAEINAAEILNSNPARELATRRLGIDSLASGSISAFASWAQGRERFVRPEGAVSSQLRCYYADVLVRLRRNALAEWIRRGPQIVTVPHNEIGTGNPATFDMGEAQRLSLLSDILARVDSEQNSIASVISTWPDTSEAANITDIVKGLDVLMIPGGRIVTGFMINQAEAIARATQKPLEVSFQANAPDMVDLLLRINGVDISSTLEDSLAVAVAMIPSIEWRPTENAVVLTIPTIPVGAGEILNVGLAAIEDSLSDPWLANLKGDLDALLHHGTAAIESLETMKSEHASLRASLSLMR